MKVCHKWKKKTNQTNQKSGRNEMQPNKRYKKKDI